MNTGNKNGGRVMGLSDIANELGLSKSTVSRALSGTGRMSEKTRKTIIDYAKKNGYAPNSIAQSLAKSITGNIGVVLPDEVFSKDIPFFNACLMGACEEALHRGYDVVLAAVKENDISVLQRLIAKRKVDGIVLTRSFVSDEYTDYLKNSAMPFVLAGYSQDKKIAQVDIDNKKACYELTEKVIEAGGARTALILGSMRHTVNQSRRAGFEAAFAAKGLAVINELVFEQAGSTEAAAKAVTAALENNADNIICGDDNICAEVLNALEVHGKAAENVKVSSFYNSGAIRSSARLDYVVDVNVREYGVKAAKALLEIIAGKAAVQHRVDVEYIIQKAGKEVSLK